MGEYETLSVSKNSTTIDKFLINNNNLRHVVRRAFIAEQFPYSEIQDNTIDNNIIPIDMLRLKLSFFGAIKFEHSLTPTSLQQNHSPRQLHYQDLYGQPNCHYHA